VWLAGGAVAAVYLLGVTDAWWPTPDSALYQGLGRELYDTGEYRFNGQVEGTVTPGLPVILGGLYRLFGEGFWAPNLLMTLCGLGALWLAWRTLLRRTDPRTAFAVVLTTAGLYRYYDYCHLILTDAPFVLLFWLTAYGCVRVLEGRWAWLAAVVPAAGAAIAIRAPGLMVLGPWAVAVVLDRGHGARLPRRLVTGLVAGGAAVAVAAVMLMLLSGYVKASGKGFSVPTRLYSVLVGLTVLPDELANTFLAQRSPWLVPVGGLLLGLAVIGGASLWRRGKRLAAVTCGLNVLGICFVVGFRSIRARYMTALYPLLLLLIFEGLFWSVAWLLRRKRRPVRPAALLTAATVFSGALIAINVPKTLRHAVYYSTMGRLGRYHEVIDHGIYAELRPTAELLRTRFGPSVPIAARPDRVTMLHLLGGVHTTPFKQVCPWNPWNAAHAEEIFADLQARREVRAIVFDRAELDKRFVDRMRELLDGAADLKLVHGGKRVRVYERLGAPAAGPASAPSGPSRN